MHRRLIPRTWAPDLHAYALRKVAASWPCNQPDMFLAMHHSPCLPTAVCWSCNNCWPAYRACQKPLQESEAPTAVQQVSE